MSSYATKKSYQSLNKGNHRMGVYRFWGIIKTIWDGVNIKFTSCKYHCSTFMFIVNIIVHPVLYSSIVKPLFVTLVNSLHIIYHGVTCVHSNFEMHWGLATIPSRMMCWGSCLCCMFYYSLWVAVSNLPSGGDTALLFSPPLGFTLGFFTLVGELQLDQMSFDPLPSLPRNPILELHWGSSPGH